MLPPTHISFVIHTRHIYKAATTRKIAKEMIVVRIASNNVGIADLSSKLYDLRGSLNITTGHLSKTLL
jgi:hypothetical protein